MSVLEPAKFFAVTEERTKTIQLLCPGSVTQRFVDGDANSFVVIGVQIPKRQEAILHNGGIIESRNQLNPAILAEWRYAVEQHHSMLAEGCIFDVLTARPFLFEIARNGSIYSQTLLLIAGIDFLLSVFEAIN